MMAPEGTWAHWFWTSRKIHVFITMVCCFAGSWTPTPWPDMGLGLLRVGMLTSSVAGYTICARDMYIYSQFFAHIPVQAPLAAQLGTLDRPGPLLQLVDKGHAAARARAK